MTAFKANPFAYIFPAILVLAVAIYFMGLIYFIALKRKNPV
jgi:ABC-type antimicrobial peptide transport system permease subunit